MVVAGRVHYDSTQKPHNYMTIDHVDGFKEGGWAIERGKEGREVGRLRVKGNEGEANLDNFEAD